MQRVFSHRSRSLVLALASASILAVATTGAGAVGATASPAAGPVAAPRAGVPGPVPGVSWEVQSPEANGMSSSVLDGARQYAFQDGRNTQGIVVVRHGVIVAEWYASDRDQSSWAASWSVGKSFASALVGIAIHEGKIPSIDEPMTTYFPEWAGTPKAAITLRHVLQMESGLDWDENYDPAHATESEVINMVVTQGDELAYAASRPLKHPPGTVWNYSSGDAMLLSGVLAKATGMPADDYARSRLLDPIGIQQLEWWRDANNHTLTYCCVDTTSRDFARFGLLYLRGGQWGSTSVVPGQWVDDSVAGTTVSQGYYGYMWWLKLGGSPPYDGYAALGHDGQYVYVFPNLDLVVVRNGTYVKSACPPIADPNLFNHYPPDGLVPGRGTVGPQDWDEAAFLQPIFDSIVSPSAPAAARRAAPRPATSELALTNAVPANVVPAGVEDCPIVPTSTTTTPTSTSAAPTSPTVATPVVARPTFTG